MPADWYPHATKRPIAKFRRERTTAPNMLILHVTVSTAASQYAFFAGDTSPGCSHFHVAKDGTVEQYMPISWKDAASRDAANRSVSIETQGAYPTTIANTEPWTDAQVDAIARIAAWLHREHGLPLQVAPNSKTASVGIAGHRWGIDGNFPTDPLLGGRRQRGGGELWSGHVGKACPGDAKLRQIPTILNQARTHTQEDDMTLTDDQARKLDELHALLRDGIEGKRTAGPLNIGIGRTEFILDRARKSNQTETEILATIRAQAAALEVLATANGVDPAAIQRAVENGVKDAMSKITFTVDSEA